MPVGGSADITEDAIVKIETGLAAGLPFRTCAALAGTNVSTAEGWLREGARGNPTFVEFHARCTKALAVFQMTMQQIVRKSADAGNVKDAQWLLERRFPKEFGQHVTHDEVTGGGAGDKIVIQLVWPGSNVIDAGSALELTPAAEDAVVIEEPEDGDQEATG